MFRGFFSSGFVNIAKQTSLKGETRLQWKIHEQFIDPNKMVIWVCVDAYFQYQFLDVKKNYLNYWTTENS